MTLPQGVTIKPEGTAEFVTQRGYWTPPYKSCMFASLCSVLEWMGYDLPLNRATPTGGQPDNFVHTLHVNSGKFNHPTNTADTKTALLNTFGTDNLPLVKYGVAEDQAFLSMLQGNFAARVTMKMDRMPRPLRRWCGYGYTGAHAMAILDARLNNNVWEVLLSDPMGRPSLYKPQWVAWDAIKDALDRSAGKVQFTAGEWNTAFDHKYEPEPEPEPEPPQQEANMPMIVKGVKDEYVPVPKGTALMRPDTLAIVTRAAAQTDFKVVGRSEDGEYLALQVRTVKFPGGLVVLFAQADQVGQPFVKPLVPKSDYDAQAAQLAEAEASAASNAEARQDVDAIEAILHS